MTKTCPSEYKLVIEGRLPGLNEYSNAERSMSGSRKAAKIKREVQDTIGYYILRDLRGVRIERKVRLDIKWYEPNRKRDYDNIAFAKKFIQDALVEMGVLQNDGWKHIGGFSDSFDVDKVNPRVEVIITEI
jgi:Holliday junction resolvase RusA-like endonuclease